MAINVNEFRKGNYANYSYQGTDVIFYGYNYSDGCFTDFSSIPIEPEELDPIPLTEKLLIQLGFIKKWDDYKGEVEQFEKGLITWSNGQFRIGTYWVFDFEIHHLHQLQNLYFSITGTELVLSGEEKV